MTQCAFKQFEIQALNQTVNYGIMYYNVTFFSLRFDQHYFHSVTNF